MEFGNLLSAVEPNSDLSFLEAIRLSVLIFRLDLTIVSSGHSVSK